MLSSILNYLEGSVTLLSESNEVVVRLSDGGVYPAADFKAMTNTVSILLSRAAGTPEHDAATIEDPFPGAPAQTAVPVIPALPSETVPGRYDAHKSNLMVTFGKYKGKRLCEIEDETWFDWLYTTVKLRTENGKLFTVKTPVNA